MIATVMEEVTTTISADTDLRWTGKEFSEWMRNGCDEEIAKNVKELCLVDNNLITLPRAITKLINLVELDLSGNYLVNLQTDVCYLLNLKILNLANNSLSTLPTEIKNLANLTKLSVKYNLMDYIPSEIGELVNLELLNLEENKQTVLPIEIGNLINLKHLILSNNKLSELPSEIGNLTNLTKLLINQNMLFSLPPELMNLTRLVWFENYKNPFDFVPPNVMRFIVSKFNKKEKKCLNYKSINNIYINPSVKQSIMKLLKNEGVTKEVLYVCILDSQTLTSQTKRHLLEYLKSNEIHRVFNITFCELAQIVFRLISCDDIYYIMNIEMNDYLCTFFTGRFIKLLNCLNGFDEDVNIHVLENEQIKNTMLNVKIRLEDNNKYTEEKHREEVKNELKEQNIPDEIINEWIGYI